MPATLRSLLSDRRFGLREVTALGAEALARPIPWAHSSDLPEPAPWLEPGQLLLTNGAQFPLDPPASAVRSYVDRLVRSEIGALGFATQVVHPSVPATLADACESAGLPLLEVVDRTPFISIVRHVAEEIAADQRERLEWSLSAQRALARAALRPDGLAAVLHELQRRLECWVALFDAAGSRVPVQGVPPIPGPVDADVARSVRTVLARGHRAGVRLTAADGAVTLQTIGQRGRLRGVLAVGTAVPLDAAGTDLVASVIGLASISVEQSRVVDEARRDLRSGLLELMLAGAVDIAHATARRAGEEVPPDPVRVAVLADDNDAAVVREGLAQHAGPRPRWFVAQRDAEIVVVVGEVDAGHLDTLADRHTVSIGLSGAGSWRSLPELLSEARHALRRGAPGAVTRFDAMLGGGMLGLLGDRGGLDAARRLLAPLDARPDREDLLGAMRTWLEHGCAWDPAARELGIHRHTLRHRATTVERALGLDLSGFAGRAELWLALGLATTRPQTDHRMPTE